MRRTSLINADGRFVTIRAPETFPEGDAKEAEHHDFLGDHWMDVAAASYYGFKRYGIGAVVVADGDPAEAPIDHPFGARRLLYSPDGGRWLQDRPDDQLPVQWLDDRMQSYDPNAEAIVLMADTDGSVRTYAVESDPDPGTCFQLVRSRSN